MALLSRDNPPPLGRAGDGTARGKAPWGRLAVFASMLLLALATSLARAEIISREYSLKAVFLLNFAHFTEWPSNSFETADSPFCIGVLGEDPFGPVLDQAVKNETVNGRPFVVSRFRRVEDATHCHILFVSQSEVWRLDKIIGALSGKPVLSVSEIEGSALGGLVVRFVTEKNKIRLRINMDSLKESRLTMSSQLLRAAEIVSRQDK